MIYWIYSTEYSDYTNPLIDEEPYIGSFLHCIKAQIQIQSLYLIIITEQRMKKYLVVGAGFAGAVVAERLAARGNCKVLVVDERHHIGGNCHSERDTSTGVMVHTYGPHIFNTDKQKVWDYIRQFCEMMPFTNRVKTIYQGKVYSMPINLHTINQFYGKALSPAEAREFIDSISDKDIVEPRNFEEQAIKFIGPDLYKAFFYGYTKKQWGLEPRELPASILKRLPVRFNYNDNYYMHPYQGIPKDGYTAIFEKMLDSPNIEVRTDTKFDDHFDTTSFDHVFYTGPIDEFFGYKFGPLGYRTVYFERHEADGDFQGNAVINYADANVPYTRIHEHKHFTPWEEHDKTVYMKEFSKETTEDDVPYYPIRLAKDMKRLEKYQKELKRLNYFTFLGRLATYKYMDMDDVIAEALEIVDNFE